MKKLFRKSTKRVDDVDGDEDEEMQELTATGESAAAGSDAPRLTDRSSMGERQSISGANAFERKGKAGAGGRTELHKAAGKGRVDDVQEMLTRIKPTVVDDAGSTPLHDAAACDAAEAAEVLKLLCARCDHSCVNRKNNARQTALHIAALGGRVQSVAVLIGAGAKINEDDAAKNTCLHMAALCAYRQKAAEVVAVMCDRDADINEPNAAGKTALHLAAANGNAQVVKILLEKGAKRSLYDAEHNTALHAAASSPDDTVSTDIVRELCKDELKAKDANENSGKAGTVVGAAGKTKDNKDNKDTMSMTSGDGDEDDEEDFVNRHNSTGKTALHLAAATGKLTMVRALLKYGARRNIVDKKERTPLHYVAYKCGDDTTDDAIIHELCTSKWSPEALVSFIDRPDLHKQTALHLAAQYSQLKAVQKLLSFRASVKARDDKGETPLITAAGSKDVVQQPEILESICRAFGDQRNLIDAQNDDRKTALHIVAASGQLNAVRVLLNHGARLDIQDKDGNTALHVTLLAKQTASATEIISAMCTSQQATEDKKFVKIQGEKQKTALHLAASKGLVDVVTMLLDAGAKLEVVDVDGWTPLHEAATCDSDDKSPTIIRKFCELTSNAFNDQQTAAGETALHMAARYGHLRAVKTLLEFRPSLEIKDNDGWIPLHSSVRVDPFIARAIIEAIRTSKQIPAQKPSLKQFGKLVTKSSRAAKNQADPGNLRGFGDVMTQLMVTRNINKVLNERDKEGRTALHLAAHLNSADMIAELKSLNPEIQDRYGMTPLHVAASMPHSTAMRALLDVFYTPQAGNRLNVDIDHVDRSGDSVLHKCCREGDVEKVKMLLKRGADLEKRGAKSFTLLHRLVEVYVHQPTLRENVVSIYREVVAHAVSWKCLKDSRVVPKVDSELYNNSLREIMIYLTYELKVKNLNVMQYASKKGATNLLDEILNTPYVFKNPATEQFDITYLIPDTVPEPEDSSKSKPMSCLELIVNSKDIDLAEDVLAIHPFNEVVSNYWVLCRRVYNICLCAHIVFMVLFTIYCMPTSDFIGMRFHLMDAPDNADNSTALPPGDVHYRNTLSLYGLFLIWPAIICFMELITALEFCYRSYVDFVKSERKAKDKDPDKARKGAVKRSISKVFAMGRILMFGFEYVSHVSALAFSASTLAWYLLYVYGNNHHHYCEAIASVYIFGWMHTITYVKLFKDWHAFASIFKQIVAKDVTRFAYIFVFVLMSFSFAIHALSNSIYPPGIHARTLAETIYLTFCLTVTVTVGGLLDISTEPHYEEAGGNIHLLHIVFAGYICLSTIILLNMLIAMMNSTYSAVRSTRATQWRVESLRTALWVERKLPFIRQSLFLRFKTEPQDGHFYIAYIPEQARLSAIEPAEEDEDETKRNMRELKSQIAQLVDKDEAQCTNDELKTQIGKLQDELKASTAKLDVQSQIMLQMQTNMVQLQLVCEKLASDLGKLAAKA